MVAMGNDLVLDQKIGGWGFQRELTHLLFLKAAQNVKIMKEIRGKVEKICST